MLGFHEINLTPAVRTAAVCWGHDGTQTGISGEASSCYMLASGPVMASPHCHPDGVQSHCGNTPLSVSASVFSKEDLTERGSPTLTVRVGRHPVVVIPGVPG